MQNPCQNSNQKVLIFRHFHYDKCLINQNCLILRHLSLCCNVMKIGSFEDEKMRNKCFLRFFCVFYSPCGISVFYLFFCFFSDFSFLYKVALPTPSILAAWLTLPLQSFNTLFISASCNSSNVAPFAVGKPRCSGLI